MARWIVKVNCRNGTVRRNDGPTQKREKKRKTYREARQRRAMVHARQARAIRAGSHQTVRSSECGAADGMTVSNYRL